MPGQNQRPQKPSLHQAKRYGELPYCCRGPSINHLIFALFFFFFFYNQKSIQSTLDRSDLLGYSSDPSAAESGGDAAQQQQQQQRGRMLSATDKLQDSSRRLESSHRVALETEDLGTGILGNLRVQRDQIQGTRDRLTEADSSIDKASGTLGKMIRKCVGTLSLITGWQSADADKVALEPLLGCTSSAPSPTSSLLFSSSLCKCGQLK